jgi:anti-sigma regulatory factor (Ser/Thr protein kinase)
MKAGQSLQLNGQQSRTVRLRVNPLADFREVIRILEEIGMPPTRVRAEHIRFAILELLNNSIRAHREKGENRDIFLDLTVLDSRLAITIRDFGGGFDPSRLPYDLSADPNTLDLQSAPFAEYQKQNNYKRFGMGIYVAKRTFDDFRLAFLDHAGNPTAWSPGAIEGTVITLSTFMEAEGPSKGGVRTEAAHGR